MVRTASNASRRSSSGSRKASNRKPTRFPPENTRAWTKRCLDSARPWQGAEPRGARRSEGASAESGAGFQPAAAGNPARGSITGWKPRLAGKMPALLLLVDLSRMRSAASRTQLGLTNRRFPASNLIIDMRTQLAFFVFLLPIAAGRPLLAAQVIQADVCVYGGTPAGIAAAVQAARM